MDGDHPVLVNQARMAYQELRRLIKTGIRKDLTAIWTESALDEQAAPTLSYPHKTRLCTR